MRTAICFCSVILLLLLDGCSFMAYQQPPKRKQPVLAQVTLLDMIDRYINKEGTSYGTVEGIYSVSSIVTKRGGLFGSDTKEKVVDRQENYCKVAVLRVTEKPGREYIEIVLDKDSGPSASIVGEFSEVSESSMLLYKHFESKGKSSTYTFSYDGSLDILEGIRTENVNRATITYKLTYLKLSPKSHLY